MIARVEFEGIVKDGKKKSILPDHIDIHVAPGGLDAAKSMFLGWLGSAVGIKGFSGIFHPLGDIGTIKIKSVEEAK